MDKQTKTEAIRVNRTLAAKPVWYAHCQRCEWENSSNDFKYLEQTAAFMHIRATGHHVLIGKLYGPASSPMT